MEFYRAPIEARVWWHTDKQHEVQKFDLETHYFKWNNLLPSDFPLIVGLLRILMTLPTNLAKILFTFRELNGVFDQESIDSMAQLCEQIQKYRNAWFRDIVFPPRSDDFQLNFMFIGRYSLYLHQPQYDLNTTVCELLEKLKFLQACLIKSQSRTFYDHARQLLIKFTNCRNLAQTFVDFAHPVYLNRRLELVKMEPLLLEHMKMLASQDNLETLFLNELKRLTTANY